VDHADAFQNVVDLLGMGQEESFTTVLHINAEEVS
jgi:hypothetical protein